MPRAQTASMMFTTATDLVSAMRAHRLLEPSQLARVESRLPRFPDPRALARYLLRHGWLTAFQINQLFLGRVTDLFLGDYLLLERLGEGSMGSIFKARHRNSGRLVALKLIRKDRLANPQALFRFEREMKALKGLDHLNVVHALDADRAGDTLFLTMEYVEGTDLSRLVKQAGPLPVWLACDYVRQTALGLQHLHERGLVHRDLKPSNLMVTYGIDHPETGPGVIKVLDLGLARLASDPPDGDHGPTLTKLQTVLGTPDYISPEQARDARRVDFRGDLYSLGCTFYFLLTGQPLFPGGSAVDKLMKQCTEEPDPVAEVRRQHLAERQAAGKLTPEEDEIPPEVIAVLERLLAKRPEDRYQTAAEVYAVLTALMPVEVPNAIVLPPPFADEDMGPPSDDDLPPVDSLGEASLAGLPPLDDYQPNRVPQGLWLWLAILGGAFFLLLALLFLSCVGEQPNPHPGRRMEAPARDVSVCLGDWRRRPVPLQ
jgi:serine/threonine protein kinase